MTTPTQDSILSSGPPAHLPPPSGSGTRSASSSASTSTAPSSLSPPQTWIVQKYGGTSVGKFLRAITSEIVPSYLVSSPSTRLALVCSARSGSTKARGTTNLLLTAAGQALALDAAGQDLASSVSGMTLARTPSANGEGSLSSSTGSLGSDSSAGTTQTSAAFDSTVDILLQEHLGAVEIAVTHDVELRKRLEADVRGDCDRLRQFLLAARIIEEISPRSKDIILSLGERLSCRLVVASLQDLGIPAELVGLESVIDAAFLEEVGKRRASPGGGVGGVGVGEENQLDQHFYDLLAERLGERCRNAQGVPVVTGYFGAVPGSLLQQVGRGYTDLCAALCAVGLGALELQIWKEVDGVFTADPRKVSTARLIPSITPEEAAELTYYGSEVIHPFTMEQAIRRRVPIRIKNVENPSGSGTVILPDSEEPERDHLVEGHVAQPQTPLTSGANTPARATGAGGMPWGAAEGAWPGLELSGMAGSGVGGAGGAQQQQRRLPTAVTIKEDVLVLNVHSNRKTLSHSFFSRIFSTLDRHHVAVDLISTSEVHVSMAISAASLRRPSRTLDLVCSELGPVGTVSVLRDMAILSLVGRQMRHMVGVAGKMFATLAEGGINIEMISQGANEINISCCIHAKSALKALNLIHYSVLEVGGPAGVGVKPVGMESGNFGRSFV
ncbi:aspartate kinase [Jaminaea rosea]|uniref:aspartate kinase n=1 Tax=Jaminaea rosea TaxID=1569628 RepID=A0A316URE7_9BASI|nr:aspartate kinase [Jaminaea rosea]PWN27866.1 aspartate kinase [Jaminaea rosea]